ncbi:MAG: hypothetical protein ACK2UH_09485 [Candidatus Promineifilaceae bacterium]
MSIIAVATGIVAAVDAIRYLEWRFARLGFTVSIVAILLWTWLMFSQAAVIALCWQTLQSESDSPVAL